MAAQRQLSRLHATHLSQISLNILNVWLQPIAFIAVASKDAPEGCARSPVGSLGVHLTRLWSVDKGRISSPMKMGIHSSVMPGSVKLSRPAIEFKSPPFRGEITSEGCEKLVFLHFPLGLPAGAQWMKTRRLPIPARDSYML